MTPRLGPTYAVSGAILQALSFLYTCFGYSTCPKFFRCQFWNILDTYFLRMKSWSVNIARRKGCSMYAHTKFWWFSFCLSVQIQEICWFRLLGRRALLLLSDNFFVAAIGKISFPFSWLQFEIVLWKSLHMFYHLNTVLACGLLFHGPLLYSCFLLKRWSLPAFNRWYIIKLYTSTWTSICIYLILSCIRWICNCIHDTTTMSLDRAL